MDKSKIKIAYVITNRGSKSYWNRVGVAFVNRDGSINLKLEAVPVNGEVQIRDMVDEDAPVRRSEPGEAQALAQSA